MLPKLIFIIGAACSGKSSFIRAIDADDYICLDDVKPLYKIFKADELLRKNPKEFREFVVKNHLESFYAEDKANSIEVDLLYYPSNAKVYFINMILPCIYVLDIYYIVNAIKKERIMSLPSLFEISNLDHLEKYYIVLSISR